MDTRFDQDIASFCSHILPCTSNMAIVSCGSFNEQPLEYAIFNLTDLDYMSFDRNIIAVKEPAVVPKDFHGEVLTLETDYCHVAFARLVCHRKGKFEYFVRCRKRLHGPALKYRLITWPDVNNIFNVATKFKSNFRVFKKVTADYVQSIFCPFWPPEADEWIMRKRFSGWPTKHMIDKIVAGGCHLVPKSHQSNPNDDTTWRFSFSQAELILVTSWNEIQKYVYHILRLLKANVIKKCGGEKKTLLCTYYFKTLMLWACEEKPVKLWREELVETIVEELLLQMIVWLIERNCPNYFIRENNMLDYLPSDFDVSKEVSMLHDARHNISTIIALKPKVYRGQLLHIRMSEKVLLLGQLALNRRVFVNPMNVKFERYFVKDLSNSRLLVREIEHLFKALRIHRHIMSGMSSSELKISKRRKTYVSDALKHFHCSYNRKSIYKDFDVYISLLDSFPCAIGKFFNRTPGKHSQHICCYYRKDEGNNTKEAMEALCQSVLSTVDKNHPDPSYFISAAYYANFHYTCLGDYRQALKICEEALTSNGRMANVLGLDRFDLPFSSEVLCMFISREYMHIYDAGLQVVFGFLTLCMNSVKPNEKHTSYQRSVLPDLVVQVCPVAFLWYIRIRCRNMLHLSMDGCIDFVKFFPYMCSNYQTVLAMQSIAVLSAAKYVNYIYTDM